MQPFVVIESHDIVSDIRRGFLMVCIVLVPDALHFEIEEEALHDGVIPAICLSAHACQQGMAFEQGAMFFAGILAPSIGMNDQSGGRMSMGDCHLQGSTNQLGRHARSHRPSDDLS